MNATTRAVRCRGFRRHAGLALATALALAATSAARADEASAGWDKAATAYEKHHYAEALAAYEALAVKGDSHAAQRAGEMLLLAPALGDAAVPYDPMRAARWLKQAASAGSASAQFLVRRIEVRTLAAPKSAEAPQADHEPGPHGC